jgi:hypothetical protein
MTCLNYFTASSPRDKPPGTRSAPRCPIAAQARRITNLMTKIKQGARAQRDVKNEGCSQDLIENKGA